MVLGNFDAAGLAGVARLQFASGAVQPVLAGADGTILVGTARVVIGNIPAANGVLHIINDVLDDDISLNSTAVLVAENAGDFGPFNQTQASLTCGPLCHSVGAPFRRRCSHAMVLWWLQRDQIFTYEITFLPATLPSLKDSYRRVRMTVG